MLQFSSNGSLVNFLVLINKILSYSMNPSTDFIDTLNDAHLNIVYKPIPLKEE